MQVHQRYAAPIPIQSTLGDMSRDWKDSEATVNADGYTFDCVDSDVTVTQLVVAVDGLSVIVKKGGAADQCLTQMGGISMAQLRWVFSDWTESELEADGLDLNSTTPNNDGDDKREWGDLDAPVMTQRLSFGVQTPILEPTNISESKYSVRIASLERKDMNTEGFDTARGYQNSADDNQIVKGIDGDENAIGYFGYAYYEENANKLNVVAIANNDTHGVQDAGGAVSPNAETVADNTYAPLSRAIYMNVNNDDWDLVRGLL